jgi:hypothetical protein
VRVPRNSRRYLSPHPPVYGAFLWGHLNSLWNLFRIYPPPPRGVIFEGAPLWLRTGGPDPPCSDVDGNSDVLSRILVVPVCYGPSRAVGSSNYIEIGQSSNWLRTDRGTSLNVGVSMQGRSRCHGSGAAVGRGTCNRCDQKTRRPGLAADCDCGRSHSLLLQPLHHFASTTPTPVLWYI